MKARSKDSQGGRPERAIGPSVVLSNVYSDANRGGAAITQITARFARRLVPGARLILITVSPGREAERNGGTPDKYEQGDVLRVSPILRTPGGIRTLAYLLQGGARLLVPSKFAGDAGYSAIAEATVVISKGGYLFGYRSGARSLLGLLVSAFPLLYAWRMGIATVAYSTSVGPFSSRLHRWVVGSILRRISVVAVRDSASEQRALDLGVLRGRLVSMPDCVFSWDQRHREIDEPEDRSLRLAVVLRDVASICDFLPALESTIVRLAENGEFSTFEGVVQSLEDRVVTEQFVERLKNVGLDATIADTSTADLSELLDAYRRSAATVSARLHGAIFSVLAGTPAVSLATDPYKAEGVMAAVGLEDWVLAPTAKSPNALYERLLEAKQPATRADLRLLVGAAANGVRAAETAIEVQLVELSSRGRR